MPGGLPAVRRVVAELHAAGVKVLIPYNPWDGGTARCGGGATCGGSASAAAEGARSNCSAADPGEIPLVNGTVCDARIIDGLLEEIGADGFNGDTMDGVKLRRKRTPTNYSAREAPTRPQTRANNEVLLSLLPLHLAPRRR